MSEIQTIRVTQVRIYKQDVIPFNLVLTQAFIDLMIGKFGFRQIIPNDSQLFPNAQINVVVFGIGQFATANELIHIESIHIEPRKITLIASADSTKTNLIYQQFVDILMAIVGQEQALDLTPLLVTEETTTVVTLSSPISKLFPNSRIQALASEIKPLLVSHDAKINLQPVSFKFRVSYLELPDALTKNKITLLDKEVVVEVRAQSPIEENLYFVHSPNPSDVHMKLLQILERSLVE